MERIAKFEKVSFDEYYNALADKFSLEEIQVQYDNIKLPVRATAGSAGYDFYIPFDMEVVSGESYAIPTGIRCKMNEGFVLSLYPRSSYGRKYGFALDNTTGIIDQDYYYADNEGHIIIAFHVKEPISIQHGNAVAQGIFTKFYITEDDEAVDERHGGFGSTGNQ